MIGGQTNCLTDSQGQRVAAQRERQFCEDGDRSQGQISPRSSVGIGDIGRLLGSSGARCALLKGGGEGK